MSKNNFRRSNVNERTLSISAPNRSSFDQSENLCTTLSLGRLLPLHIKRFMPSSIMKGSLNVNMQMERIASPTIGKLRLDTHAFLVYDNRVNNDIKKFMQDGMRSTETAPHFPVWATYGQLLHMIVDITEQSSTWKITDVASTSLYDLCSKVLNQVFQNYNFLATDSTDEHFYLKDFYKVEVERISKIQEELDAYNAQHSGDIPYSFPRFVMELMRPYIGAGSDIERLGYPKFTLYSYELNRLEELYEDLTLAQIDALEIRDFFTKIVVSGTTTYTWDDENVCEYPIRKNYAVWFDYFRNFQLEKREKLLNPDDFGSFAILGNAVDDLDTFALLMISKYRTFSRDMLTTIQTDDIWRHVYAPIFTENDAVLGMVDSTNPNSSNFAILQNAISSIALDLNSGDAAFNSPFPVGVQGGSTVVSVLQHDLQVQRRAGMLEKYLQREYFTPDTYSGFLKAHYNVEPTDFTTSISQYLGGSETIVNGDQHYATMETPNVGDSNGTPRGTRTLVAGATDNGANFSYRVGGGFADLITYASLVPMVKYDAKNMHLNEYKATDMPLPEFAQDSRVEYRTQDILRGFQHDTNTLGFAPRYLSYRGSLDRVSGDYLEGKRLYDFVRDWWSITNESYQEKGAVSSFILSPYCMRVHLRPDQFVGLQEWDTICYGSADMNLFVDCPLPAVIDFL